MCRILFTIWCWNRRLYVSYKKKKYYVLFECKNLIGFFSKLFLKSVVTISQKVMNRSSSNFAHFFYIIFSTA